MIKTKNLLLIAAAVWVFAGLNVLKIGVTTYFDYISPINLLLSLLIFMVFWTFVFLRLTKKHTLRIISYKEETKLFIHFFDKKSFIIMAFMITGGILIRKFSLLPNVFIAVFYTGIGLAITFAGLLFFINFLKHKKK